MIRRISLCCLLSLGSLCSMAQTVNIPDSFFLQHLIDLGIDTNNDGLIQQAEAEATTEIDINPGDSIRTLEGISAFTNLESFLLIRHRLDSADFRACHNLNNLRISGTEYSSFNPYGLLKILRVDGLTQLVTLNAADNNLMNINLENLPSLRYLNLSSNRLTSVEAPQSSNLTHYKVHATQISELDLSYYPDLRYAGLVAVYMDTLSFEHNPKLIQVAASHMQHLDLSHNDSILFLEVQRSPRLKSLDLSNLYRLERLQIARCHNLEYLNIKNGSHETRVIADIGSNAYICIDEDEEDDAREWFPSEDVVLNSFCTFQSANATNQVRGNFFISTNGQDCTDGTPVSPIVRLDLSGDITGSQFQGNMNNYELYVPTGQYELAYNLLNPLTFTVTPNSQTLNFSGTHDTITQDVCFIGQGDIQDISALLWPEYNVRPGFSQYYMIEIENKGNRVASGTTTFYFPDSLFEVTEIQPMPSTQNVGSISWEITNLAPLTKKYALVKMRANSPMDTPPLVGGEVVSMSLEIPLAGDINPADNSRQLTLEVKNSFDPNDKTCLEGTTISHSALDDYLTYRIRFENTGTAEAVNIVVRDEIDTTRFDISTFQPLSASHPFKTIYNSSPKIEFVFEGINLPFNDQDNDGYIVFKIKPKQNLTIGDQIDNKAAIYFDYNHPIITDPSVVRIEQLSSTTNIDSHQDVKIFPNPTAGIVNITSPGKIELLNIFNPSGQRVMSIAQEQEKNFITIDISNLPSGYYRVEIKTDQKTTTQSLVIDR